MTRTKNTDTNDTNTDANATPVPAKAKQPTPCERAEAALARAESTQAQAGIALETAKQDSDEETIARVADLVSEVDCHVAAVRIAVATACLGDVPYARRLTASGRAKTAADSAEQAAGEIKGARDRSAAEADEAKLAELENCPGYTKNPEWIAIQERIEARRF